MRHQVELQVRTTVQDGAGEPSNTWNLFAKRRAAIQRTPGEEVFASAQRGARVPVIIRIRWLAGVTNAMRLIFRCACCADRGVHDVKVTDPTGLREELLITAEEHVEQSP